jgi:hypothetical protein
MTAAATVTPNSRWATTVRRASIILRRKSCGAGGRWIAGAMAALKQFGPYAAIELVLPGGSLIALLLWLHRRRQVRRKFIIY